jgi:ribosomal protein S25
MTFPDDHPGTGLVAERSGINLYSEFSLHDQVKRSLAGPGDRMEAAVAGKVVDLLKANGEIVEVQTRNRSALLAKVRGLAAAGHRVRVVPPIPAELLILRKDPNPARSSRAGRAPSGGTPGASSTSWSARRDSSPFPAWPGSASDSRHRDTGARRYGVLVEERRPDGRPDPGRGLGRRPVGDTRRLAVPHSRRASAPWTSESLGEAVGLSPLRARKVLYCLARAGLLKEAGRSGRRKLYLRAGRRS